VIPEPCWMFGPDLSDEVVDAMVCMDATQWAVVAFVSAACGEPVQ